MSEIKLEVEPIKAEDVVKKIIAYRENSIQEVSKFFWKRIHAEIDYGGPEKFSAHVVVPRKYYFGLQVAIKNFEQDGYIIKIISENRDESFLEIELKDSYNSILKNHFLRIEKQVEL